MLVRGFLTIAKDLETAGLLWQPEIGDEVAQRDAWDNVSVLVDPQGMTPKELREVFLWLPTVEQLLFQFEARHAILFHAGLELSESTYCYKTVVRAPVGPIESKASSLREAMGRALTELLIMGTSPIQ